MSKLRNALLPAILGILICGIVLYIMYSENELAQHYPRLSGVARGNPIRQLERYNSSKMKLTQIEADSTKLYLLYGYDGVLEVFDHEGVYQYSYAFCDDLNGRFELATEKQLLYVNDCHGNLYILRDGVFQEYLQEESCRDLRVSLRFGSMPNGYEIKYGNVWKHSENENRCIIQRQSTPQLAMRIIPAIILLGVVAVKLRRAR